MLPRCLRLSGSECRSLPCVTTRNVTRMKGLPVRKKILEQVKQYSKHYFDITGRKPRLAIISTGDDGPSQVYIKQKISKGKQVGIQVDHITIELHPGDCVASRLESEVERLCTEENPAVGVMIQLPVFDGEGNIVEGGHERGIEYLRRHQLLAKDVDGMHPCSEALYRFTNPQQYGEYSLSCTPQAVREILEHYDISLRNRRAVVIGRSSIVGMPMLQELLQDEYQTTVTSPRHDDPHLAEYTRTADLVIVAAGSPNLIKPDMISKGAVLVDIGINRISDPETKKGYRLVGDIDSACNRKSSAYTPVPGGIGPVTVAVLMRNTVLSAYHQANLSLPKL